MLKWGDDMYITTREKDVIELIIKTAGKHTASSIGSYLHVSTRTIQRDLKAIEKILAFFQLQLARNTNKGLLIEGKNEQIFRLIQHLAKLDPIDQTPQERQLLLLLALLQEEFYTIQILAKDLGVSITTLTTYLDELENWLANFNIRISRKRGVGIEIIGTEPNKRKALARFFLFYFNEELIESLFLLETGNNKQETLLYYLNPDYLLSIHKLVNVSFNRSQLRLADSDYIGFIVHICITLQRKEDGFLFDAEEEDTSELTNEFNLITNICTELENIYSISLAKEDLLFLAVILKGSKLQEVTDLSYDKVMLSQVIRNLIIDVSSKLHVDLTQDFSLYQGLLAHMEPSLYRLKQKMGLFNPLKEEIKRKYPLLFMAIKSFVEEEFQDIDDFPDDEIAFIVLHFGSALLMREEQLTIKALVLCPTGIGTSKMLASRIKKEIIEIDEVEIKSIKDIQAIKNLNNFDIIISTVKLPFMDVSYILVSPLLSEENIAAIKSYLKNNIKSVMENKQYSAQRQVSELRIAKGELSNVLQDIKDVHQSIDAIMNHFCVFKVQEKEYVEILKEMVTLAKQANVLTDVQEVIEALQEREKQGGLGIPNTDMALFHCRHEDVKELMFQISHLEEPCLVKGMDGKDMYMKNLLLMIAPEELSLRKQEIVNLISTNLIESNEAIMIFSSANEEAIRTKLETTFLDYLHTNLIKD